MKLQNFSFNYFGCDVSYEKDEDNERKFNKSSYMCMKL